MAAADAESGGGRWAPRRQAASSRHCSPGFARGLGDGVVDRPRDIHPAGHGSGRTRKYDEQGIRSSRKRRSATTGLCRIVAMVSACGSGGQNGSGDSADGSTAGSSGNSSGSGSGTSSGNTSSDGSGDGSGGSDS